MGGLVYEDVDVPMNTEQEEHDHWDLRVAEEDNEKVAPNHRDEIDNWYCSTVGYRFLRSAFFLLLIGFDFVIIFSSFNSMIQGGNWDFEDWNIVWAFHFDFSNRNDKTRVKCM